MRPMTIHNETYCHFINTNEDGLEYIKKAIQNAIMQYEDKD